MARGTSKTAEKRATDAVERFRKAVKRHSDKVAEMKRQLADHEAALERAKAQLDYALENPDLPDDDEADDAAEAVSE